MAPHKSNPKTIGPDLAKPLSGRIFLLDLPRFRGFRRLESDLVDLGGRVETFLNKDVSCVITNRDDERATRSANDSTSFWGSRPRGRALVKRAHQSSKGNGRMDVLSTASAWGVQIKHVKSVLKWIDDFKSQLHHLNRETTSSRSPISTRTTTRQLRSQYFKAEDVSRSKSANTKTKKPFSKKNQQQAKALTRKRRRNSLNGAASATPVSTKSPVNWSPSPTPLKEKRAKKSELRKRLQQVQRKLSFSGFDGDPIESKIVTVSRLRRSSVVPSCPITPKKRKLESSAGSYTEIAPPIRNRRNQKKSERSRKRRGSERPSKVTRARHTSNVIKGQKSAIGKTKKPASKKKLKNQQQAKTPARKRRRNSPNGAVSATPVSPKSPVNWSPSPTPLKEKRAKKSELRKRLKQVQRKLSLSGFDDDPIESKILTVSRLRRPAVTGCPITPKKRKNESSGNYTEIAPPVQNRRNQKGGERSRKDKGSEGSTSKTKRTRHTSSKVIKDLIIRLDDVKANRPNADPMRVKNHVKVSVRPQRACGAYQTKRSADPTIQQVARQLKKELAATTPAICTMNLRNGKTKIAQS